MKTREQMRLERRSRVMWVVSVALLALWAACLLCTTAGAATAEETGEDTYTLTLALIGAGWVAAKIVGAAERLDRKQEKRQARGGEPAAKA